MRHVFTLTTAILAISCAEEGPVGGVAGAPLNILEPDATPGCFTDPPAIEVKDASDAFLQVLSVRRQMMEFQLTAATQKAMILVDPVRAEPTLGAWSVTYETGTLVEGTAIARGDDWGMLKMIAVFEHQGEVQSIDADIDVTPSRTVWDFGNDELEQRPNVFRYGTIARGCDPDAGLSFEVGAPIVLGDQEIVPGNRCWRNDGVLFPGVLDSCESAEDPERCLAEWKTSFELQCLQVIEKAFLW